MAYLQLSFPRIMKNLVILASLHSILLGIILIIAPHWLLNLFGWTIACDSFFLQQAGVFHVLLGLIYWREWYKHGSVFILASAKISAAVFLTLNFIFAKPLLGVFLADAVDIFFGASAIFGWYRITKSNRRH